VGGRREDERVRRAIEVPDWVFRNVSNIQRQGDPVSIPPASAEDSPRLGSCLWIIIRVICDIKQATHSYSGGFCNNRTNYCLSAAPSSASFSNDASMIYIEYPWSCGGGCGGEHD